MDVSQSKVREGGGRGGGGGYSHFLGPKAPKSGAPCGESARFLEKFCLSSGKIRRP